MTAADSHQPENPRDEIDVEVAVERLCDPQQRVDARRASATLEPRDCRLRRAAELG